MPSLNVTVRRYTNSTFLGLLAIAGVGVIIATNHPAKKPPGSDSTTATLKVVPTMLSVTVSPHKTAFARCRGGTPPFQSTHKAMGYPNGKCVIIGPRSRYPIVITNGRPPARVDIESTVATPADGGTPWQLCTSGTHSAVPCHGHGGKPGFNQFTVQNFAGGPHVHDVTAKIGCDVEFNSSGGCMASSGQIRREGIRLIGPSSSGDHATTWHVTITWMAEPP